jgi:hypothetical protein
MDIILLENEPKFKSKMFQFYSIIHIQSFHYPPKLVCIIVYHLFFIVKSFFIYIQQILGAMAHTGPVVCDVLPAAIKKPRSGFSGGQNVPEKNRTKARSANCGFS